MLIDQLTPTTLTAAEEGELVLLAREVVGIPGFFVPSARAMDARERLVAAYMPAVKSAVLSSTGVDREDLEADLVEQLLRIIADHDPTRGRIASRIGLAFRGAKAATAAAETPFTVPSRERTRFFNLLYVTAGGDYGKALIEADKIKDYNRWRFVSVARALNVSSIELELAAQHEDRGQDVVMRPLTEPSGAPDSPQDVQEREELVQWLLDHLTVRERLVIELGFGFTGPVLEAIRLKAGYQWDEELSDNQLTIIPEIGLHSRRSIIRERMAAMVKMRAALELEP